MHLAHTHTNTQTLTLTWLDAVVNPPPPVPPPAFGSWGWQPEFSKLELKVGAREREQMERFPYPGGMGGDWRDEKGGRRIGVLMRG